MTSSQIYENRRIAKLETEGTGRPHLKLAKENRLKSFLEFRQKSVGANINIIDGGTHGHPSGRQVSEDYSNIESRAPPLQGPKCSLRSGEQHSTENIFMNPLEIKNKKIK